MILDKLTGKALPYVVSTVLVLVLVMAGAIWMLVQERDSLNQSLGQLEQTNKQYEETIQQNETDYDALQAELQIRDAVISKALHARQRAERKANDTADQLRQALQGDDCANTRHPDAVSNSLRHKPLSSQDED